MTGRVPLRNAAAAIEPGLQSHSGKAMTKKSKIQRPYSPCYVYLFVVPKMCALSIGI